MILTKEAINNILKYPELHSEMVRNLAKDWLEYKERLEEAKRDIESRNQEILTLRNRL